MAVARREQVLVALVSLVHTMQYKAFGSLMSRIFVLNISCLPGIPLLLGPNQELAFHPRGCIAGVSEWGYWHKNE